VHDSRFPGVEFTLGDVTVRGAGPWANLPGALRSRLNFIHHRTSVNAHTESEQVMGLNGRVLGQTGIGVEMLPSAIAQELARPLSSTQSAPFVARSGSGVPIRNSGSPISEISPTGVRQLLGGGSELQVAQLTSLRDSAVDALYNDLRTNGTAAQRKYFDGFVKSRSEARRASENLAALLADINGDTLNDTIIAVTAILASRTNPVAVFSIPFGGDNHADSQLNAEVSQTTSGVAAIGNLWNRLNALGIQDQVTFAQLNVFGRTFRRNTRGGRDHNRNHSVLVTFGPKVKPGVTGGITATNDSFGGTALGINSVNGTTRDPDINQTDTLSSVGKTLMALCGIPEERINKRISNGKIIQSVLKA
jgi:hypothetical protein